MTTDIDNTADELTYSVTGLPLHGQLELSGNPGVEVMSFTQQQINNAEVVYIHDGSETATDNFNFIVGDGQGAESLGSFNISISSINENAPSISDQTVSVAEDSSISTVVYQFDDDNTGGDNDSDGDPITLSLIHI